MSKLKMAATVAGVSGRFLVEQVTRPAPTRAGHAPGSPDRLTKEWLTDALCRDHPGTAVTGFELGRATHGSTARQPLEVTYNEAGRAAGLPTSIFTKSTPRLKTRLVSGLIGGQANEVNYYMRLRPHTKAAGIEGPDGYYAVVDKRSQRSLLLLEDVSPRVRTFGDPTELVVDRSMAESLVHTLGSLHGTYWDSHELAALPWLSTSLDMQVYWNQVIPFLKQNLVGAERFRTHAPPEFIAHEADINAAFMRSLELNVQGPQTLLHQDVHLGNWYVSHDGRMGLYDYQCIARGGGALDLAYALTSALTIENRRTWERDLIELYLSRIEQLGAKPPTLDEMFLRYRQQTFHGLCFWLFTIGYSKRQQQMQPDHISVENLKRMTTAVIDLRSFEALDETP